MPLVEAGQLTVFQLKVLFLEVCKVSFLGGFGRELDALGRNRAVHGVGVVPACQLRLVIFGFLGVPTLKVFELLAEILGVPAGLPQVFDVLVAVGQLLPGGIQVLLGLIRFLLLPADVPAVLVKDLVDGILIEPKPFQKISLHGFSFTASLCSRGSRPLLPRSLATSGRSRFDKIKRANL